MILAEEIALAVDQEIAPEVTQPDAVPQVIVDEEEVVAADQDVIEALVNELRDEIIPEDLVSAEAVEELQEEHIAADQEQETVNEESVVISDTAEAVVEPQSSEPITQQVQVEVFNEQALVEEAVVDLQSSEPIAQEIEVEIIHEQALIEEAVMEPHLVEPIAQVETHDLETESPPAVVPDVIEKQLQEVNEPIQVATEVPTVQTEEVEINEISEPDTPLAVPVAELPELKQLEKQTTQEDLAATFNLEDADRLVDQVI